MRLTSIALCKISLDGKSYVASMMQDLNGQNLYFLGARCILSSDGMNFRNCMVHDLDWQCAWLKLHDRQHELLNLHNAHLCIEKHDSLKYTACIGFIAYCIVSMNACIIRTAWACFASMAWITSITWCMKGHELILILVYFACIDGVHFFNCLMHDLR